MIFRLNLFEGTDSIKFGTTRKEIKKILRVQPTLFKASEFDTIDSEKYDKFCHVHYEQGDGGLVAAAFHFFEPSKVFLLGVQCIGLSKDSMNKFFIENFKDAEFSIAGCMSKESELVITFTWDGKVQSVFFARKGYGEFLDRFRRKAFEEAYGEPPPF